jgi:hypothetical protein
MVGFHIFGFDLPFIVRCCWHHGVKVPSNATTYGWKSWNTTFIDLMVEWRCGEWKTFISLDNLARYLGVGSQPSVFFGRRWAASSKDKTAKPQTAHCGPYC